jgi:MFS family permease
MYQIQNSGQLLKGLRRLRSRERLVPGVGRVVFLLGLTSFFTDISSEMVATILPIYLVYTLGFTPLQYGLVDGLYQGAATVVRLASGLVGDRWRRHKEVAVLGYGLSALSRPLLLLAGGPAALSGIVVVDRIGKGIRTAPRDALISLGSKREALGSAFGVHRAMDTAGAMLGPLLAFSLLALAPDSFDAIFIVSFCIALVGLAVLVLFVENPPVEEPVAAVAAANPQPVSLRAAAGLLRAPRYRALVLVGAALALGTVSDGFVYLGLQRRLDFDVTYLPLLYVGTALTYMFLAVPVGRLADRIGRGRVFLAGYLSLLLVYGSLLVEWTGVAGVLVTLLLLGTYYAATDGVLMALASAVLPEALRGSGLALLTTGTTLSRLLSSVLFGAVWTAFGIRTAIVVFAAGLAVAGLVAALMLRRTPEVSVA